MPSADTDELAKFGYQQELDRSLGLFSSLAAGFSYISGGGPRRTTARTFPWAAGGCR
jgi:hypothetical protein